MQCDIDNLGKCRRRPQVTNNTVRWKNIFQFKTFCSISAKNYSKSNTLLVYKWKIDRKLKLCMVILIEG